MAPCSPSLSAWAILAVVISLDTLVSCLPPEKKQCKLSKGGAWIGRSSHEALDRRPPVLDERTVCPRILIPTPKEENKNCYGVDGRVYVDKEANNKSKAGHWSVDPIRYSNLAVRAVKYVPRPVGKVSKVGHVDLYDDHFHYIHERDLFIIARILKANTIRIDPWVNENEHKKFFEICKKHGLMVIPTFDLAYFFRTRRWSEDASFSELKDTAVRHFDEFLKNVRLDEPVLMWSINHGLFLNQTTANGMMSKDAYNRERLMYFELIKAFRDVHYTHEWNKGAVKNAFARPLALPLLLDSRQGLDSIGWYLAFAETEWSKWPPSMPAGLDGDAHKEERAKLEDAGAFDAWIAETMPTTQEDNVREIAESIALFNDSRPQEITDVTASQYPDCTGEEDICNYATSKAVLLQYGFASLHESPQKLLKMDVDIDRQQKYLGDVWKVTTNKFWSGDHESDTDLHKKLQMSCITGAVIDEWADDWDRCATLGYDSMAFIQNKGGICDEVRPGKLVHMEWFGLNSQYSFMGMHCIDPRFRFDGTDNYRFRFDNASADPTARQALILEEQDLWKRRSACAWFVPDMRIIICMMVASVIVLIILFWRWCKVNTSGLETGPTRDADRNSVYQDPGLGRASIFKKRPSVAPRLSVLKGVDGLKQDGVEVRVQSGVEVPMEVRPKAAIKKVEYAEAWKGDLLSWTKAKYIKEDCPLVVTDRQGNVIEGFTSLKDIEAPPSSMFPLTFTFEDTAKTFPFKEFQLGLVGYSKNDAKGKGRFTNAQALMHLKSHARIQVKRLRHQLQCEALAVQALEAKLELAPCYAEAMVNVHARALEGYTSWLESEGKSPQHLTTMLNGYQRQPWELWIEAILARILESMAEHILHSPELLAGLFHEIRWNKAAKFTIQYDDKWERKLAVWKEIKGISKFSQVKDSSGMAVDNIDNKDGPKPSRDRFPLTCICDDPKGQEANKTPSWEAASMEEDDGDGERPESMSSSSRRQDNKPQDKPMFTIDYKDLHGGINKLIEKANPFDGGVNFDDINDCGSKSRFEIEKTYRESASVMVVFDIMSNFQPVFVVKAWLLMLAWYSHLGEDKRNGAFFNPKFERARIIQVFAIFDSIGSFAWEFLIFVHGLCWQKRLKWMNPGRWLVRRLMTMLVTGAGAVLIVGQCLILGQTLETLDHTKRVEDLIISEKADPEMSKSILLCCAYFLARVVLFVMLSWLLSRHIPYLPGRPKGRTDKLNQSESQQPLTASFAVRGAFDGGRSDPRGSGSMRPSFRGTGSMQSDGGSDSTRVSWRTGQHPGSIYSAREEALQDTESPESEEKRKEERKQKLIENPISSSLGRHACWGSMLIAAFFFEKIYIVPLAAGFDWDEFCGSRCGARKGLNSGYEWYGSDCLACNGTLVLVWSLVSLTGFIDIYYIFYFGTAIFGYAMGEWRGLRNMLSTALRHLDLDSISVGSRLASSRPANDKRDKKHKMKVTMSDGEAMKFVFGVSWRMVWSRIVEALYDDCLITEDDVKTMVQASSTVRWTQKEHVRDRIAGPGDRFRELRFTSQKTRGDVAGIVKTHRCISKFHVQVRQFSEAISFEVEESATTIVTINDKGQCAVLQQNLDKQLIVQRPDPDLQLEAGWMLSSGEDVIAFNKAEMLQELKNIKRFPARVVFDKIGIDFDVVQVNLLEKRASSSRVYAVSFSTGHCDSTLDPVNWKVEGLVDDWKPGHVAKLRFLTGDQSVHNDKTCELLERKRGTWHVRLKEGGQEFDVQENNVVEAPGVEGSPEQKWKQLVWQDTVYLPPMQRGMSLSVFFSAEYWRLPQPGAVSHTVDLHNFLPVVNERLGFFTASLRGLLRGGEKYNIRPGIDTLLDSHIGNIPCLSQIIPVYSETVILSVKMLRDSDGVNTNLGFIISQFVEEWNNFCRRPNVAQLARSLRFEPEQLYQMFSKGHVSERLEKAEYAKDHETAQSARDLIMEVRMWASMRSQTVSRTVVGAIQYHEVLALLPSVQTADDPAAALEHCVELVLAHQTYGGKNTPVETDADVRYLLERYSKYPFYLVFDYDITKGVKPPIQEAVRRFMQDHYSYDGQVRYASVLARHRKGYQPDGHRPPEDSLEIVEVLPRQYPLLIGDNAGFTSQGKAGNQLGALRFSKGHYLQMMDANMGSFLGEACKVPFVLRRFQPSYRNRMQVEARIIGFRETIFTHDHGAVGAIMASAEWSFGTICQRFLAGLGARMHYGHPDFLDGFWASNRGSLSKASPMINLSEDIFAGFNVLMRGEKSKHVDSLAWEKGRESSFNAASLFFTKVSKGNVGVMRSRDLKIITESLSIVDNFSFYFASVAFYVNNLLIDFSVLIYVFVFVLLTLASKSLREVGMLDSMLATEWIFSMGIVSMAPRFMELTLEYGPLEGILKFIPSMPGCMMMFTFINKSIASGVAETMLTGEASYIGTGRPNANTHYSWRECYFIYCRSHYYPALKIITCYLLYRLLSEEMMTSSLPMIVLLGSVGLWIVAPILFCPQPTLKSLMRDLEELWQFIIATPDWSVRALLKENPPKPTEAALRTDIKDKRATLYEFWLLDALQHKKWSKRLRLSILFLDIAKFVLLLLVTYSSMLDQIWNIMVLVIFHFLLMELWRVLYRPVALVIISMFMWIFVPPIVWPDIAYVNLLVIFIVAIWGLQVLTDIIQLMAWICMGIDSRKDWATWPEKDEESSQRKNAAARQVLRYDMVVEYLYVNFLGHQLHLYSALAVLLLDLIVQSVIVVIDAAFGLHSWMLLNGNLRSQGICARREGYEPGRQAASSAQMWKDMAANMMSFRPSSSFRPSFRGRGSLEERRSAQDGGSLRESLAGVGQVETEIPEVRRSS